MRWVRRSDRVARSDGVPLGRRRARSAARCSSGSRPGSRRRPGRPVVSDLRARDVAAGGQGAPLVSIVDVLWLRGRPGVPGRAEPRRDRQHHRRPHGEPVAFDTGPANALIDAVVTELTGRAFDADGAMAGRGQVHGELLERLLAEPYYAPVGAEEHRQGTVPPPLPRPGARGPVGDPRRRPGGDGDDPDRPDRRRCGTAIRRDRGDRVRWWHPQSGADASAGVGARTGAAAQY